VASCYILPILSNAKVSNHEWHEWADFTNVAPSFRTEFASFVPLRDVRVSELSGSKVSQDGPLPHKVEFV
jgi:hypothetical protein